MAPCIVLVLNSKSFTILPKVMDDYDKKKAGIHFLERKMRGSKSICMSSYDDSDVSSDFFEPILVIYDKEEGKCK